MTVTPPAYRWNATTPTQPWPQDLVRFPRRNVVGEIKPHNKAGITAGIEQLTRRTAGRRSLTPQLLTYRQVLGQPSRYEVLAADSAELRRIIASGSVTAPTTWYRARFPVVVPEAVRMIPVWQCPTMLGNLVEGHVRAAYAAQLGISLPQRHASRTGADFAHESYESHELQEVVDFLRELASELAAELEREAAHP